jgi:hypothetical protein
MAYVTRVKGKAVQPGETIVTRSLGKGKTLSCDKKFKRKVLFSVLGTTTTTTTKKTGLQHCFQLAGEVLVCAHNCRPAGACIS